MNWTLPISLLHAGALVLWPLATVVCRPTSATRLVVVACITSLAVIAAVWTYWVIFWLIE
jgi:hypothetical protein